MQVSHAIGIDLGTTFSVMAYVNSDGRAEIIPNLEGERLTPSVVYFDGQDFVVGQAAVDAGLVNPDNVAQFVKRSMGQEWHFSSQGRQFSAPEISAQILKKLKTDAEIALGSPVGKAVITVPAYFGEAQRRATRDAAQLAGLEVLRLINEPTAAAIAYGVGRNNRPETMLVYDLGGGTFDVTICHVDGTQISVLATDGDANLGGKDFDDRILGHIAQIFQREYGVDPLQDRAVLGDLRERAVRAKHQLSSMEQAQILVQAHGKRLPVELTRSQFEDLGRRLLTRTQLVLNTALRDANLGLNDIDRILLTGGSTRMSMVKRMLSGYFGRPVELSMNPDEVVALGAAVIAAREQMQQGEGIVREHARQKIAGIKVFDVISHSLGIQASRSSSITLLNKILIPRNSQIPCDAKQVFHTDQEETTSVRVVIMQGETEEINDCQRVGEFILSDLPAGRPAGMPIEVTIVCTENGIVEVNAKDVQTGKSAKTAVNYAGSAWRGNSDTKGA